MDTQKRAAYGLLLSHGSVYDIAAFIRAEWDGLDDTALEPLLFRMLDQLLPEMAQDDVTPDAALGAPRFRLVLETGTANYFVVVNDASAVGKVSPRGDGLWHPSSRPYAEGDGWLKASEAAKELLGVPQKQIVAERGTALDVSP